MTKPKKNLGVWLTILVGTALDLALIGWLRRLAQPPASADSGLSLEIPEPIPAAIPNLS